MNNWRKSSYSSGNGGNCVETAGNGQVIAVRDTKEMGHGPVLRFGPKAWAEFTASVKKLLTIPEAGSSTVRSARPLAYLARRFDFDLGLDFDFDLDFDLDLDFWF